MDSLANASGHDGFEMPSDLSQRIFVEIHSQLPERPPRAAVDSCYLAVTHVPPCYLCVDANG